jgi:hypothetical protein
MCRMQGFILLTNYQRYVDEFITWATSQVGGYSHCTPNCVACVKLNAIRMCVVYIDT